MMFNWNKKFESMTMSDFVAKMNPEMTVVDVRSPMEFQRGHIEGATNHPLNQMSSFKGNMDKPIYMICQSGMRSAQASRYLADKGYKVVNVKGGMSRWPGNITRGGI